MSAGPPTHLDPTGAPPRRRAFGALLRALLIMDFRSQQFGRATATKAGATITPLFWVIGQYLLISGTLAVAMFARVDAYFFALSAMGTSIVLIATSVIVEFNEIVLDASDLEVIGHQPVSLRTYSAARIANLLLYVLGMTVALNVFPAIIGMGLRDSNWTFLPAYSAAALSANLLTAGGIILLYTLLGSRPGAAAREVLAWSQILFLLVFFYGAQLVFRDTTDRLQMVAYRLPSWVHSVPPAWLARFVTSCLQPGQPVLWWILAATAASALLVWAIVLNRLGAAYGRLGATGGRSAERARRRPMRTPGRLAAPLGRLVARGPGELAAYWLCATMLRRDHDLKMRSWPALGIVLAPLALGVALGELADPMTDPGRAGILSLACLYMLATPVPTILHNLSFSRDHRASWVLQTAPLASPVALAEGARKAVTYRILLPVLVLIAAVFAWQWREPVSVALHAAAGWGVILAAGHASVWGVFRRAPLSRSLARGETMGEIMFFAGTLSGVSMGLAGVHYYVAPLGPGAMGAYLACLAGLVVALRAGARAAVRHRGLALP